jgi:hypothetical protein
MADGGAPGDAGGPVVVDPQNETPVEKMRGCVDRLSTLLDALCVSRTSTNERLEGAKVLLTNVVVGTEVDESLPLTDALQSVVEFSKTEANKALTAVEDVLDDSNGPQNTQIRDTMAQIQTIIQEMESETGTCPVCLDKRSDRRIIVNCGHWVCRKCKHRLVRHATANLLCPMCRALIMSFITPISQ